MLAKLLNELDQTLYSIKNKSEVISYKSAFEAFYASDAPIAPVAFVQQYQPTKSINQSNNLDQASYEKKIESQNIESANNDVSAKIICRINFVAIDFISAEVIAASNKRDQLAYD